MTTAMTVAEYLGIWCTTACSLLFILQQYSGWLCSSTYFTAYARLGSGLVESEPVICVAGLVSHDLHCIEVNGYVDKG